MRRFYRSAAWATLALMALTGTVRAEGLAMAVGQNPTKLTQTRISNAGGGAAGNPHWGGEPYQSPWSTEDNIFEGENYGEAFKQRDTAQYNGYALRGEDAPWDADPGASGRQRHGGNAANAD